MSERLISEWCQNLNQSDKFIQEPFPENPEEISAAQAIKWTPNFKGLDMRPRVFDKITKTHILVDSGSAITAVPAGPDDVVNPAMHLRTVSGQRIDCCGKKTISVQFGRKRYHIEAVVAKINSTILGWDFICKYKFDWVWDQWGNIHLLDKKSDIRALLQHIVVPHNSVPRMEALEVVRQGPAFHDFVYEVASIQSLQEELQSKSEINNKFSPEFQALIDKYPSILTPKFEEAKTKHKVVHRIEFTDDTPVYAKVRPLVPGSPKAEGGKKAWFELLRLGIIEKVDPNQKQIYTSALHLTPKKDGTQRPTGDYRAINAKTVVDRYPLPALKTFTSEIKDSTIFSRIDLTKSYHQIAIHEDDKFKTCIVTPWGPFQFRRLAMGLNNSAQCLQKLLDSVLGDMPNVFIYLDDLLVYNKTKEDHLKTIEEIFRRLDEAGLSIAPSKCEFGKKEIEFLGFKVNRNGITPLSSKISSISKCPTPTKQKELLRYLGMLNYYRHCYQPLQEGPNSKPRTPAEILQCLYTLATQKLPPKTTFTQMWKSDGKFEKAFSDSKKLLINATTLNIPTLTTPSPLPRTPPVWRWAGSLKNSSRGSGCPSPSGRSTSSPVSSSTRPTNGNY